MPKLNANGEMIALDSGGYGPVTITQGVTIEAPPGVTAFIHPPSGTAVTVNAPGGTVTLRRLVLNGGTDGIFVQAAGAVVVESCGIAGFTSAGIQMAAGGSLNVKDTDVKNCAAGVFVNNSSGYSQISIDHCRLDNNVDGFFAQTISPGASNTTATNSTANQNSGHGWLCGNATSGVDDLLLESCAASENGSDGLASLSANASSLIVFSNCAFDGNSGYAVDNGGAGSVSSRGNNDVVGPFQFNGTIGTFLPK